MCTPPILQKSTQNTMHITTVPIFCSLISCVWRVQGGTLRKGKSVGDSASQEKLTDSVDLESCPVVMHTGRKRKTTQNTQSHGSFFLRVGAIGKRLHLNTSDIFITIHQKQRLSMSAVTTKNENWHSQFRKNGCCSFCICKGRSGLRSFAIVNCQLHQPDIVVIS